MATAIRGILLRDARARRQSFTTMMTTTPQIVIKSGISVVTALVRTFFKEFTSPITRARILPVGRLSKKEKDNVWICSYSSCRISSRIWLEIRAITYMRTFTITIKTRLITNVTAANLARPPISFLAIYTSMASSIINGFINEITTVTSMQKRTLATWNLYGIKWANSRFKVSFFPIPSNFSSSRNEFTAKISPLSRNLAISFPVPMCQGDFPNLLRKNSSLQNALLF